MRLPFALLHRLVRSMHLLGVIAAVLITAFVFLSAIMRYLIGSPLRFSDEFVGLLFMAMAFMAIPLAQMRRKHISVSILTHIMPPRLRQLADAAATLILIAFGVGFVLISYEFTGFSKLINSRSDIAGLLLWPWMALMPACTLVLILVALAQLYNGLRVLFGYPSLLDADYDGGEP